MIDDFGRGPKRKYRLPRFLRRRYTGDRRRPIDDVDDITSDYVPAPEDFLPAPPKPRSPLNRTPKIKAMRPALICFALFWVLSLYDWRVPNRAGLWASGTTVLEKHQYWRLLTALFVHSDMGHLLSNAPLFLIFGWFLYAFFGWRAFPAVALLIGAFSNLITVYAYPPNAELLGASGMLYGMVALWLVLYLRFETTYPWGARLLRAVGVSLLLLFPTTFRPETSYLAHLAGFILGIMAGSILALFISPRTT